MGCSLLRCGFEVRGRGRGRVVRLRLMKLYLSSDLLPRKDLGVGRWNKLYVPADREPKVYQ